MVTAFWEADAMAISKHPFLWLSIRWDHGHMPGLLLHPILLGGVLDAGNPQVEQGFSFLYLWRERLGDGLILTTITLWQSQLVCGL